MLDIYEYSTFVKIYFSENIVESAKGLVVDGELTNCSWTFATKLQAFPRECLDYLSHELDGSHGSYPRTNAIHEYYNWTSFVL